MSMVSNLSPILRSISTGISFGSILLLQISQIISFIGSPFICPMSAPIIEALDIPNIVSVYIALALYICSLRYSLIVPTITTDSVFSLVSAIYLHRFSFLHRNKSLIRWYHRAKYYTIKCHPFFRTTYSPYTL